MTQYADHPVLETQAEIIHAAQRAGITLPHADEYELWELASAIGLHRVETREDHDNREITEAKQEYWAQTQDLRADKLAGYAERRKERELARKQARHKGKNG